MAIFIQFHLIKFQQKFSKCTDFDRWYHLHMLKFRYSSMQGTLNRLASGQTANVVISSTLQGGEWNLNMYIKQMVHEIICKNMLKNKPLQ